MLVFGVVLVRFLAWDLADSVYDFGSYLLVKRGGTEVRVPLEKPLAAAAGKLISAIQKEWGEEAGRPESAVSEEVMHTSHGLLQAAIRDGSIASALGTRTVAEFLGVQWVHEHPKVWPYIQALEAAEGSDA